MACAGSVGEGWAVPGQGSAPLPLTLDLERPPRSYWEGEQTVPPPCTCPINGGEVSGLELARALTFTKHVPALQPERKRTLPG